MGNHLSKTDDLSNKIKNKYENNKCRKKLYYIT